MRFLQFLQVLFSIALLSGFTLWYILDHTLHGYAPESPFLRWWHDLPDQPEFDLMLAQLAYPPLWWISRGLPWNTFWRTLRSVHLGLVLLLLLATGLLYLATPDLGGHWG